VFPIFWAAIQQTEVCRSCFQCSYQMSKYRFDKISEAIRNNVDSSIGSQLLPSSRKLNPATSAQYSYGDMENHILDNVLNVDTGRTIGRVDDTLIVASKMSTGSRSQSTIAWLETHIHNECDKDPERKKYYTPFDTKADVFNHYHDLRGTTYC